MQQISWLSFLCTINRITRLPLLPASDPAKDCVRKMLVRDPKRRASAIQILQHDWMRENGVASDSPLQLEVLTRIKKFSAMNRLKKEALKVRRQYVLCVLP